ncbi:MAG: 3-isopropylmalate dehydratase small subunit [Cytophagales bacterium]|nr:3-isopropylmalate dehydratase small subunit [Cytophagales bacterium]
MTKGKFTTLLSTAVPLPQENVDTDQIIPARFLKATTRDGFGENLFRDWRYDTDDRPLKNFVLNNRTYQGKILLAGKNFGCGSSREHAAWALYDYGFRVVISSFFADIFRSNALNNGLLPVVVEDSYLKECFAAVNKRADTPFCVDLQNQNVTVADGNPVPFEINPYKKACLIHGQDDIDYLLSLRQEISQFESAHSV